MRTMKRHITIVPLQGPYILLQKLLLVEMKCCNLAIQTALQEGVVYAAKCQTFVIM